MVSEDETLPKTQMPLGMEGELWIGGIGVAKGYLHAPDLTKEVVRVPQPQSTADCRMSILSTERNLHHPHSHSHSYLSLRRNSLPIHLGQDESIGQETS